MKIAVIQFKTKQDHDANLYKAYSMAKSAEEKGVSLVSFPEFFSHDWFVNKPKREKGFYDDTLEKWKELAKSLSLFMVISYYEIAGDRSFNTTVLFNPEGDIIGKYRKNHLPNLAGFYEREWYQEGDLGLPVFQTDLGNIGFLVCSDVMFPACAHILSLKKAEVIIVPRATLKKAHDRWNKMLIANSIISGCYILSPNRSEVYADIEFDGHSMIIEPGGNIIGEAEDKDEILICEYDRQKVKIAQSSYPCNVMPRMDLYYKEYGSFLNRIN